MEMSQNKPAFAASTATGIEVCWLNGTSRHDVGFPIIGYPLPDSLPELRFESQDWFSHRACKDHRPCPVFGLYDDHGVVLYVRDPTPAMPAAVIAPPVGALLKG
jgi:hypothetical protein